MNLRKRGLESEGNRTDMFFVLPDVLPIGGGTRGVLELSRQIKTFDVHPGDKELLHLCTVLEKTDVNGVVKAFLQLNAVQQRHLANRILQELQQCDDDLLHCEEFTQVVNALGFPAVFDQPGNPHPLKCHRMCRRQLCPVCLMCTGHQKAHCVGIKLNGNLCCEKAEMLTPMAELSWWIPGVDVDLVETAMQQQAKLLAPGYDDIFVSGPLVGEGVCALRDQPTLLFEGTNELLKSVGALDLCTTEEFRNYKSHNQEGCVS